MKKLLHFVNPVYNVNVLQSENGSVSASPISGTYGTEVTLTNTPDEGYVFEKYELTGATLYDGNKFKIKKYDVNVKGYFEAIPTMVMWSGSYTDNSWTYSLVKLGSEGTVTIDTADQFVNACNNVNSFIQQESLSTLTLNITNDLWFNFQDPSSIVTANDVYDALKSTSNRQANSGKGPMINGLRAPVTIDGGFHRLIGLYTFLNSAGANGGSFIVNTSSYRFTLKNIVFDRCYFRTNSGGNNNASGPFSLVNGTGVIYTESVIFNRCMIRSESSSNYIGSMFAFMNANNGGCGYHHTDTAFYRCGFSYAKSWNQFAVDGGISNWSSTPYFDSIWNNCSMIGNFKAGGNGTMNAFYGNRANPATLNNCTYYDLQSINPQGTSMSSEQECIDTFNNTSDKNLELDGNNLVFS